MFCDINVNLMNKINNFNNVQVCVLEIVKGCFPRYNPKGDCFDLMTANRVQLIAGNYYRIRLGVAMQLPKGTSGRLYGRSSTFKRYGLKPIPDVSVMDYSFSGPRDEWNFLVEATRNITIEKNTPICQFDVVVSQFATTWQKIKWLFSGPARLVSVDTLTNPNRSGIGSTDKDPDCVIQATTA